MGDFLFVEIRTYRNKKTSLFALNIVRSDLMSPIYRFFFSFLKLHREFAKKKKIMDGIQQIQSIK